MPYLHNLVTLRRDIRWDKNSNINREIINLTQVSASFQPNQAYMNMPGYWSKQYSLNFCENCVHSANFNGMECSIKLRQMTPFQ